MSDSDSSFDWSGFAKTAVVSGSGVLDNFINRAYYRNLQQKVWEREDSAMQRRVADLEKAGLSPALALGGQGANTSIVSKTPSNMSASIAQGFDTYEQSVNGRSLRELQKAQEKLIKKQEEQADELHEKQLAKIQAEIDALGTNANANLINATANATNAETNKGQFGLKVQENERNEQDFKQQQENLKYFGVKSLDALPVSVQSYLTNPVVLQELKKAINIQKTNVSSGGRANVQMSTAQKQAYIGFINALAEEVEKSALENDSTKLKMTLSKVETVLKAVDTGSRLYTAIDNSLQKRSNKRFGLFSLLKKVGLR